MKQVNLLKKLAKVKSELQAVTKGANNPFFKSKYADLNTHLDEVEPRLEKHGLMLLQPVALTSNGENTVSSIIVDIESGEELVSVMKLVGETDMQKAGSAITYARRYTLGALLSMKAIDDDGEGAVRGKTTVAKKVGTQGNDQVYVKSSTEGTASNNATKPRASFKKQATVNTGDDI